MATGLSMHGVRSSSERESDLEGKLPTPALAPRRERTYALASKFIGWPAVAIIGQLFLQFLGWGFFITVQTRGQVALPFDTARWVKNNAHLVTLLVTLLATMLAGFSSFLFSIAIRRSMSLYLNRPLSLATLGASVSISMHSIVFHRRNWKWPMVSLFFVLLTGIQTSSWSTLLTPVPIVVSTPLVGSELDLANPTLHQMLNNGELDDCVYHDNDGTALFVVRTESGYAAAKASHGQPSTFTVLDQVFNGSTGGVLPAYMTPIDSSAWFQVNSSTSANNTVIPVTTHNVSRVPDGFSTNYTIIQQGFTADVSCDFQDLTANDSTPSIQLLSAGADMSPDSWGGHDLSYVPIVWSGLSASCDGPSNLNISDAFTSDSKTLLMAVACGPSDNYTLFFASAGGYNWIPMTVCSVVPKITTVHVDYTAVVNTTLDPHAAVQMDPTGPAGLSAVNAVKWMVSFSQGIAGNVMGDHLTTIRTESQWESVDALKPIMENYIRGVVEYTGSAFRACLTANTTFTDGLPQDMTISTTGFMHTETLGYTSISGTTRWILVPGTLIAFFTILVVGVALYRHAGDIVKDHQFDPSDPLQLMAAAAAGGLSNAFKGLGLGDLKEGEKLNVVLGSIPGHGPALVRADQYTSVVDMSLD
ncbi:hypothetical protein MVEN_00930600 [Mycena venus]|uniref:Uncharacterized protein n=1 Tax=Mycena venus TaxID=2733690 RepID=A0A8H6YBC9_9AGAR|nr:hypothetical protein MVEN_00930600 [Mycena venus]